MIDEFILKSLVYFSIAGMSLILIYHFAANGKRSQLLYSYCVFQALVFLWAFHDIILETHNLMKPVIGLNKVTFLYRIYIALEFIGTCFIPYVWLVFSLTYAEIDLRKKKTFLLVLGIPPVVFFDMNFFGYFAGVNLRVILPQTVLFFLYIILSYSYLAAGIFLLIRQVIKRKGYSRKQAIFLSVCIVLPLIASIVQNVRIRLLRMPYEVFGIDLSLVSFTATMLCIAVATFRYRLLKTVPYALRELFQGMDQPVVVADRENGIIDFNDAFSRAFPGVSPCRRDLADFAESLFGSVENGSGAGRLFLPARMVSGDVFSCEVALPPPASRRYSATVRPVFINGSDYVGKVIVFNDITELKNMIEELNAKNSELSLANERLKKYSDTVEALAVEHERTRLAGEVHDTLGQSMTIITTLLNAGMIACDHDIPSAKEKFSAALNTAKEGLSELRQVVRGLLPEKLGSNGLSGSVRKLTGEYMASGLRVELTMDDIDTGLTREQSVFVFRLCQEALTNSVRHGKAENVSIIIRKSVDDVRIFISDDGSRGKEMVRGYGLTGMEHRAAGLGGNIRFWYGEERGFNVYGEFPLSSRSFREVCP